MTLTRTQLQQTALDVARKDVAILHEGLTVGEAMQEIREKGIGEKIVYFYVVDREERLVGVLPTRRLLISPPELQLSDVMIRQVMTLSREASLMEAYDQFVRYKLLAFPIVDEEQHILGVVDVGVVTNQNFNASEKEDIFETIGFHLGQVRDASPWRAFRFRFPWLGATIASGVTCAVLASIFEVTLAQSIVLAFFLTLVLGLAESVSMQSMTVTIQALRAMRPTLRWYAGAMMREIGTAVLLGGAAGAIVGSIVWVWRGDEIAAIVIGASILVSMGAACLYGLTIPTVLHALRLDPKIAAGPVTLAITDITTVVSYLGLAMVIFAYAV